MTRSIWLRVGACVVALAAMVLTWFSATSVAGAVTTPDANVASYTYDVPVCNAPGVGSASERGPPAAVYVDTANGAVDRWSHGASARPAGAMPPATYTYDHPVPPV